MPATEVEIIAANLRRLREARGMSQEALAGASGLPPASYSRIERAESSDVKLSSLLKIARALGVRLADVLEGVE